MFDFTPASGNSDSQPWVHPSELIIYRCQLATERLKMGNRKFLFSPDGTRVISFPPSRKEAYFAIMNSFDQGAIHRIAALSDQYQADPQISATLFRREIVRLGIEEAIFESLDVQFPFLRSIDRDIIRAAFEFIQEAANQEEIDGAKQLAIHNLDEAVGSAQKQLGSEWTQYNTDYELTNRINRCVEQRQKAMKFDM